MAWEGDAQEAQAGDGGQGGRRFAGHATGEGDGGSQGGPDDGRRAWAEHRIDRYGGSRASGARRLPLVQGLQSRLIR